MDFVFFLGRMHVLVLHIPIGVILLAVIVDWLSTRPRFAAAAHVSTLLWGVAAVTGILSVATGLMHAAEGGFAAGNIDSHRFYAILTTVGSVVVWLLRWRGGPSVLGVAKAAGLVTFVAMLLTLHYGSRTTHGDRFLSVGVAGGSAAPAVAVADALDVDPAVEAAIAELGGHGLQARRIARNLDTLTVAAAAPGMALDAAAVEAIAAAGDYIVELNLSRASLPPGALEMLAPLTGLATLRLDNAGLGDADLAGLAAFGSLRVLNLHGNPDITNRSVEAVAALADLERVYLWSTAIDSDGIAALGSARPDLAIQAGEAFAAALVTAAD